MTRRGAMTTVAALLGIVAAAAIAWSASQLAGQRIGLSSEPLSVANRLAPAAEPPDAPPHRTAGRSRPDHAATVPAPASVTLPATPSGASTQAAASPAAPTVAPTSTAVTPHSSGVPSGSSQPRDDGGQATPSGGRGGRDD